MQSIFVVAITTLILAYFGNVLMVAANAGNYWVFPAAVPVILAFAYWVSGEDDRKDMRQRAGCFTDWLQRRL